MPNKDFEQKGGATPPRTKAGSTPRLKADRTKDWPGLPGPTQRRSRSHGVPKVTIHPTSEGI